MFLVFGVPVDDNTFFLRIRRTKILGRAVNVVVRYT